MSKQKYPASVSISSDGEKKKRSTLLVKKNGYSNFRLHAKQDQKRNDAEQRQSDYNSLTIAEKISLAVSRGGSKRELARLDKKQQATTPTLPTVKPTRAPKTKKS